MLIKYLNGFCVICVWLNTVSCEKGYMSTFIYYTYMLMLFHVLVCRFGFVRVTVVYISVNISAKVKGTTTALSTCSKSICLCKIWCTFSVQICTVHIHIYMHFHSLSPLSKFEYEHVYSEIIRYRIQFCTIPINGLPKQ